MDQCVYPANIHSEIICALVMLPNILCYRISVNTSLELMNFSWVTTLTCTEGKISGPIISNISPTLGQGGLPLWIGFDYLYTIEK
jgi:hypothetical protein